MKQPINQITITKLDDDFYKVIGQTIDQIVYSIVITRQALDEEFYKKLMDLLVVQ